MRSNPLSKAGHERRLSDVERPERLSAPQPSLEAWAAGSSGAAVAGSAEAAAAAIQRDAEKRMQAARARAAPSSPRGSFNLQADVAERSAGRTTSVLAPPPPDSPGRRSRRFSSTPRTPSV